MAGSVSGDAETPMSGDSSKKRGRGGWITFPFMIATLLGLTIAAWGWLLNLIVYLIEEFNVKSIAAAQISNIVSGCICMVPALGAVAADSFFGTIPVISFSAFVSLMGVALLTLTAFLDSLRPKPCETGSSLCESPSKIQLSVLYAAITLASIGTGGTRFTLATAGANQYEKAKDQGSFFNWFFFTTYLAGAISATGIVYSEDNVSWTFGFGLCVVANLVSFLVFVSGKRFYKHDKPLGSPFTSLLRVIFVAVRKRDGKEGVYHNESSSTEAIPTTSLRFFNRAALKQEDDEEVTIRNPWRLCSVQEVEDFKSVIRIIPLALATIFLSTPIATQLSLTVLQGLVMDRRLGSTNFKIPAGSLQVITLLSTCLFIIVNDRFLYPFYKKLTGKFLTPLQKVGIGHVFNILSMAVTALVEAKRLKIVEKNRFLEESSSSVADISVLWLFPPLVIVGIGEAFHFPGNVALCYQEFPESMKSTATSITSVVIGICFYTSTALIDLIQKNTAWLPDDINHGRVDNVYWVLVVGGVLNLGYFLVCSWVYRYRNLKEEEEDEQDPKDVTT